MFEHRGNAWQLMRLFDEVVGRASATRWSYMPTDILDDVGYLVCALEAVDWRDVLQCVDSTDAALLIEKKLLSLWCLGLQGK